MIVVSRGNRVGIYFLATIINFSLHIPTYALYESGGSPTAVASLVISLLTVATRELWLILAIVFVDGRDKFLAVDRRVAGVLLLTTMPLSFISSVLALVERDHFIQTVAGFVYLTLSWTTILTIGALVGYVIYIGCLAILITERVQPKDFRIFIQLPMETASLLYISEE